MVERTSMRKNTKGFYSVEAAIILPLVILAVLTLGYFIKVEGTWENCVHGAVDESMLVASRSYNKEFAYTINNKLNKRIKSENDELKTFDVKKINIMYKDKYADSLTSYRIQASMPLKLPLGFSKEFKFQYDIKYRGFVGKKYSKNPLGVEGLEKNEAENPVWIFPFTGEKYHGKNCRYVKTTASAKTLTRAIKKKYKPCKTCNSDELLIGDVVYCFSGSNSAYHKGSCSTVTKHVIVIDKSEAIEKGYSACSKCGGH